LTGSIADPMISPPPERCARSAARWTALAGRCRPYLLAAAGPGVGPDSGHRL